MVRLAKIAVLLLAGCNQPEATDLDIARARAFVAMAHAIQEQDTPLEGAGVDAPLVRPAPSPKKARPIRWEYPASRKDMLRIGQTADIGKQSLWLHFTGSNCAACEVQKPAMKYPTVANAAEQYVCVWIDVQRHPEIASLYELPDDAALPLEVIHDTVTGSTRLAAGLIGPAELSQFLKGESDEAEQDP